ncbi:MAG: TIGR02391 family protein, partial [Acidobacteria bacterium]|nr:TIGR02391 family protein [Acidobacteriota bacterium]MCA1638543.1 TIGR02391 family protein [Acidobacteriota bacterium]
IRYQAVKLKVKKKTGNELDGASLMDTAFSPKTPIISLDDLGTESGRNIQTEYMQIFACSMTGIRSPKAHDIINT